MITSNNSCIHDLMDGWEYECGSQMGGSCV